MCGEELVCFAECPTCKDKDIDIHYCSFTVKGTKSPGLAQDLTMVQKLEDGSRKCLEENLGLMENEQTLSVPLVLIHGSPPHLEACLLAPPCQRLSQSHLL